jgi:hypothetical protein
MQRALSAAEGTFPHTELCILLQHHDENAASLAIHSCDAQNNHQQP